MDFFKNMTPNRRSSALAAMMLAVLLASTGLAWLFVWRGRGKPAEGEQWYLTSDASGKVTAWEVHQRSQDDSSGSSGYQICVEDRRERSPTCSFWRLNADATEGNYVSLDVYGITGYPNAVTRTTHIDYQAPVLTIRQTHADVTGLRKKIHPKPTEMTDSYIPEGRFRPVIVEAARTQKQSTRKIVIDGLASVIDVRLAPRPTELTEFDGRDVSVTVVSVTWGRHPDSPDDYTLYYVTDDGVICMIEEFADGRLAKTKRLVGYGELERNFPAAHAMRTRELQNRKWD